MAPSPNGHCVNTPPFFVVTLTHPTWEEALACAKDLPSEALPELRLDLFPESDPAELIQALGRRCLVTCRRPEEGGRWAGSEAERLARLIAAVEARPAWMDLEWDLAIPREVSNHRAHVRLIRSVHAPAGVFDLEARLARLPEGEAFKWVGVAASLSDNARLRRPLAWAKDHGVALAAFLMGPKGLASRCLQGVWGGSFTYAAPDDGPPAAPGQLPIGLMRSWRLHRLTSNFSLCAVIGEPVFHSRSPAFHNARFQRNWKDLVYLPLETGSAEEACEALDSLGILGASLTAPLKESVPQRLGLQGPLNTLWRRSPVENWHGANTDAQALGQRLSNLAEGCVLVLGGGGVAATSRAVVESMGRACIQTSRRHPVAMETLAAAAPVGVIQATSLGMEEEDPMPFPDLLEAVRPTLRWAVEWVYKTDTRFAQWSRTHNLTLVAGAELFDGQAEAQSRHFIEDCG